MSTTYSFVCDDCMVKMWSGQSERLYSLEAVEEFVYSHVGHKLRFICDLAEDELSEDYREIDR